MRFFLLADLALTMVDWSFGQLSFSCFTSGSTSYQKSEVVSGRLLIPLSTEYISISISVKKRIDVVNTFSIKEKEASSWQDILPFCAMYALCKDLIPIGTELRQTIRERKHKNIKKEKYELD